MSILCLGTTSNADLSFINLARALQDGEQIYVPQVGEALSQPAQVTSMTNDTAPGSIININNGTLADLDTLPGIGPAIAQRIIDYRQANGPFMTIEQIMDVSGIGPATFDKIKDQITVTE
jgi:competence protein ComEA